MIEIDGQTGEGGGQVLRTSLALSICTHQPFRIENIRGNRSRPGLRRQHLTGVLASAEICGGETEGAVMNSSRLTFEPGEVMAGEYAWNIGTAGSAHLVLQTVLPPLMTADGPSRITLEGGTHNSASPPWEFLAYAFLPTLARFGPRVDLVLERYGFYPKGGGKVVASIDPVEELARVELMKQGEVKRLRAVALSSNLPSHIGDRELQILSGMMGLHETENRQVDSPGPGNVVFVSIESEAVTEVFTGFGSKGIRAEAVARGVGDKVLDYVESGVPVGPHLADQLLVPMALAGGGKFRTITPTRHARTNAEIIKQFLDVEVHFQEEDDFTWVVEVTGRG